MRRWLQLTTRVWPALRRRPWAERAALGEAALCLGLARLALLGAPMRWLAPLVGRQMAETLREDRPEQRAELLRVGRAITAAARRLPWRCMCFEQALAARLMLGRRRIESTLYLGVARSARGLEAHAWLRSGSLVITGAPAHERFTMVASFADRRGLR